MSSQQIKTVRAVALAACIAFPSPMLAGSYGDTAIREGNVTNTARNTATVPCARLNANVPASLAAEMDCSIGQATPRVAGERVRNNPIANFFDRFPNERRQQEDDDDDNTPTNRNIVSADPTSDGSEDPTPTNSNDPTPENGNDPDGGNDPDVGNDPDGGSDPAPDGDNDPDMTDTPRDTARNDRQSKWDRLSEIGVTRDNFRDQDKEFRQDVRDFRRSDTFDGDWSGFDPN